MTTVNLSLEPTGVNSTGERPADATTTQSSESAELAELPRYLPLTPAVSHPSDPDQAILVEYCLLALKTTLSEAEQNRLAAIFERAEQDAIFSFWIEECDHLVAHHLALTDSAFIQEQQDQMRRAIGQSWIDPLWQDLQSRPKVLQAYLQRQGMYQGSIDGIIGPSTEAALQQLREQHPTAFKEVGWSDGNWETGAC